MASKYVAVFCEKQRAGNKVNSDRERDRPEETEPLNAESGGALDTAFACKSSREGSNTVLCTSGHFKSENAISRSEMNHSH